MRRAMAIAVASLTAALWSPTAATADPLAPQPDTPCASNLSDVMTWPPGAKMPLVCRAQRWELVATPQPPNDRWLSYGPAMTLHGEGLRNPNVASGDWTATPAGLEQPVPRAAASGGQPRRGRRSSSIGRQARRTAFIPSGAQLFSIEMSGYCLWTRTGS
jgi:hypothetical protein